MGRIENRVVAVPTIQFQLPRVKRVTKWNRLHGLVANVQRDWIGDQTTNGSSKQATTTQCGT